MPLLFDDELRDDVLRARVVLAAPEPLRLGLAGLLVARPEVDFAPALLAAVTLAPAALAPALLAALLAVLRAVVRAAEVDFPALLARLVRELAAGLPAVRALLLRALLLRALLARVLPARDVVRLAVLRDELPVVLRPGVTDLASCSMSLMNERLVDFASRRRERSVSATSLYALRAFLPRSARTVCSAWVASSSAFSKRAVAASTSWRLIGAVAD